MVGNSSINSEVSTPQSTGSSSSAQSGFGSMLPMLVIFVVFIFVLYFFSIRPNKKRQKEHKERMNNLRKGDKIQTIGGWRGTVADIKEKTIVVRIDDNAKIEIIKEAVSDVLTEKEAEKDVKKPEQSIEAKDQVQEDKK